MEGRLLARARGRLENIRTDHHAEESLRHAEIAVRLPEIPVIEAALRGHMTELVGLALGHPGRSAEELERESLALQEKRRLLLVSAGYPGDYLEPICSCPRCRDTGFVEGIMCDCLLRLYKQEQTKELSPLLGDGEQRFENFRLDYYSAVPTGGEQTAPRARMERIYQFCRRYAEDFSPASVNLILTGEPGLGKTFLSASIARVVAENGSSVAYDTVSGLLGVFEREKFSRDEDEQSDAASRARQLLSCDLLILDDLGTELDTAFTRSALYTLIDGRLRSNKKTVISTNLSKEGISERYGAQLSSRLCGEYNWLVFTGRDIRSLRKEQR